MCREIHVTEYLRKFLGYPICNVKGTMSRFDSSSLPFPETILSG